MNYDVELSDAWNARAKNKTTNVIRGWSFAHCIAIMRTQRSWEKDIEGFKEQSSRPVGRDKQKKLDAAAKKLDAVLVKTATTANAFDELQASSLRAKIQFEDQRMCLGVLQLPDAPWSAALKAAAAVKMLTMLEDVGKHGVPIPLPEPPVCFVLSKT